MKGIYCLLIELSKDAPIKIGKLGKIRFNKGKYIYVGSAMNNLEKRIARHLRKNKKKFWHIDYLLGNKSAKILKVYYKKSEKSWECRIARKISKNGKMIKGFGCSDCNCNSHLYMIGDFSFLKNLMVRI